MDLIIKPTELCNFKCTFCSSPNLSPDNADILDENLIFDFLEKYPDTRTIIVNGGDPLVMNPLYYWNIIEWIEAHNLTTTLSFTSNLWDFYKRPDKWVKLFKHKLVGVNTSFNYGESRRITDKRVFAESDFRKISDMMLDLVGYRPDFIAVIDDENIDQAMDHIKLAKEMNVICKLNYVMSSGNVFDSMFHLADIYNIYLDIYDQGLAPWEYNTQQMVLRMNKNATTCPLTRNCDEGIRTLHPDGSYYSCGAFADDNMYEIKDFNADGHIKIFTPLQDDINISVMKPDCYSCSNFDICNGCYKRVHDVKRMNAVEVHCDKMMALSNRLSKLIVDDKQGLKDSLTSMGNYGENAF